MIKVRNWPYIIPATWHTNDRELQHQRQTLIFESNLWLCETSADHGNY